MFSVCRTLLSIIASLAESRSLFKQLYPEHTDCILFSITNSSALTPSSCTLKSANSDLAHWLKICSSDKSESILTLHLSVCCFSASNNFSKCSHFFFASSTSFIWIKQASLACRLANSTSCSRDLLISCRLEDSDFAISNFSWKFLNSACRETYCRSFSSAKQLAESFHALSTLSICRPPSNFASNTAHSRRSLRNSSSRTVCFCVASYSFCWFSWTRFCRLRASNSSKVIRSFNFTDSDETTSKLLLSLLFSDCKKETVASWCRDDL